MGQREGRPETAFQSGNIETSFIRRYLVEAGGVALKNLHQPLGELLVNRPVPSDKSPIRNQAASLASAIQLADYEIGFPDALLREAFDGVPFDDLRNRLAESLDHIMAGDSLEITRVRKDRVQTFNGRPSLLQAEIVRDDGGRPAIKCRLTLNRSDSARPESLTSALCTWTEFDPRLLRVHRTGLFIPGRDRPLDPLEVVRQDFAWWSRPVRGGTAV